MAITTLAGATAGEQQPVFVTKIETAQFSGSWVSYWTNGNNAGTNNTGSANGITYSSSSAQVAGQLRHIDPPAGSNAYLATIKGKTVPLGASSALVVLVVDRLWQGGTYPATTTASQAITTPTFPARDINGSTNGDGVLVFMEVVTSFTANTTVTLTYTNEAGTGSRTATAVMATASSTRNVTFFGLQSGDEGVRSIQSVAVSAAQAAGTYVLVAYRVLAMHIMDTGAKPTCDDVITLGMPRLYNGTVPFIIVWGQGANARTPLTYVETQG